MEGGGGLLCAGWGDIESGGWKVEWPILFFTQQLESPLRSCFE